METQTFVESAVCRRKFVLHYFGEEYPKDNCGACDNCLNPKETIEGKDYFKLLFETVKQLKESFTIPYIVDIVLGTKNQQISLYGHDKLNVFGEGSERTTHFWNSVVRQALLMNYITKDIENYGVICLSDAGKAFLKKPQSVQITLNHDYVASADDDDDNAAGGSATLDPVLMKMLQTLVKEEAKKANLPPYIVFQESSLMDMATQYPTTIEELSKIQGVSLGKAQRYGKPFVDVIKQYVEDNDIERPMDFQVKSVANKSANKIYIIQNIDKKIPLDIVAKNKGMSFKQLIEEMETIVNSGTKLNITYYLNDLMDEDRQTDAMDYFREAENDSIESALVELGSDDYTEEELKLMRLKFVSDMGN